MNNYLGHFKKGRHMHFKVLVIKKSRLGTQRLASSAEMSATCIIVQPQQDPKQQTS